MTVTYEALQRECVIGRQGPILSSQDANSRGLVGLCITRRHIEQHNARTTGISLKQSTGRLVRHVAPHDRSHAPDVRCEPTHVVSDSPEARPVHVPKFPSDMKALQQRVCSPRKKTIVQAPRPLGRAPFGGKILQKCQKSQDLLCALRPFHSQNGDSFTFITKVVMTLSQIGSWSSLRGQRQHHPGRETTHPLRRQCSRLSRGERRLTLSNCSRRPIDRSNLFSAPCSW